MATHNDRGGTWTNFFTRLVNTHGPVEDNRNSVAIATLGQQLPVDKKLFEKTWKRMDEVVRQCQHPQIKLRNSPPYLLEILPECYRHLYNVLDNNPSVDSDYIRIFLLNMIAKCKRVKRLFSEAKEKMYDEKSQARRDLTKFALVFSHMFFELKSLYPADKNYAYVGTEGPNCFKITKVDAADWWRASFGTAVIIPWDEFLRKFCDIYKIDARCEILALKTTLDLTCDDYVSIFEFDVFTRLFQPWNNLLACWKLLAVVHPAFVNFMTYDDVKERLTKFVNKHGSYIFRMSCTRLGQWAIGYVTNQGEILQTIPQNKSLAQALVDGQSEGFYKFPNGQDIDGPDVSVLLGNDNLEDQVVVSQEMFEVYVEMGTTFQACKICTDRDKDTRIEPCGHLICAVCVNKWMNHDRNHSCPFCRREIKGTGPIRVELGTRRKSTFTKGSTLSPKPTVKNSASLLTSGTNGIQRTGSSPDIPVTSGSSSRPVPTESNTTPPLPPPCLPPPLPPTILNPTQVTLPPPVQPIERAEESVPEIPSNNGVDSASAEVSSSSTSSISAAISTAATSANSLVTAPPLPSITSRARSSMEDSFIAGLVSDGYGMTDVVKALDIAEGNQTIARRIIAAYLLPSAQSSPSAGSNENDP